MSQFDTSGSGHLPVGSPIKLARNVRYHLGLGECPHDGGDVCRVCADLTEPEARALDAFFAKSAEALAAFNAGGAK